MKRGADVVLSAKPTAVFECMYNLIVGGQIIHGIAHMGMGFQGQYLAVDSKILNAVIPAISKGVLQGVGIVRANFGKVFKLLIPGIFLKICCSCAAEFNGRFTKDAA